MDARSVAADYSVIKINRVLLSFVLSDIFREFKLVLNTNKNLFAPNFHLRLHEANGRKTKRHISTKQYVTGHLEGQYKGRRGLC